MESWIQMASERCGKLKDFMVIASEKMRELKSFISATVFSVYLVGDHKTYYISLLVIFIVITLTSLSIIIDEYYV
ncbi:unnamed protein product [Arabidopsis halleri]